MDTCAREDVAVALGEPADGIDQCDSTHVLNADGMTCDVEHASLDIPEFVSMPSASTSERVTRTIKACGRRTARGSSSESSPASSADSSPAHSPRGPPGERADDGTRAGISRLHMDSDPEDLSVHEKPVRFSVEGDGTAMETDSRGASHAKTSSEEAHGTEGKRTAHPAKKKQVEFDGDGWEDVGDSGDDEDNGLFGCVGDGEDDYYDPDMDDLDQQFVDNRRLRHMPKTARLRSVPKPPKFSKASTRKSEHSADAGLHADIEKPPSAMPDAPSSASDAQPTAPGGASCEDGKMGEVEGAASGAASDAKGEEGQASLWKAYVAPTGHEYYHNAATGETTWAKPDGFEGDGCAIKGPCTRTDAILSCPCCFAILCLDCQRHSKYLHQYRAMFVQNCQVLRSQRLRAPADGQGGTDAIMHPVRCKGCEAEVGVIDQEEVFHFFDVIPSNG